MANQHLTRPPSEILRARLKVLLQQTNDLYRSGKHVLEEDLVSSYQEAIATFMKSLDGSVVEQAHKIKMGLPADPLRYNIFTNSISRDLEALFAETGALDKMVTAGFNSIISEREEILQASKHVSNKVGDYLLFADPSLGAGFFFGDSFNTAERVELNSSLVSGDECHLGQEEGAVFLPLDGTPDTPSVKSIIINASSNGTPGNDYQLDVTGKTEIEAISDNEPNTWYEYEKVTAYESNTPLILDLTITLRELSIINHVHINPINFGTASPVKIVAIETSQDGQGYRSVLDEVPTKEYVDEGTEATFSLSPATSKFAGQGFFSFLPRRVQYVHIVLHQEDPYPIKTLNGERLRYAIGLRDINVMGRKFKADGQLVSTPFSSSKDLRKISIWTSETPTPSSESTQAENLASIDHAISEDDGATWRSIQPTREDTQNVAEVIDYNTIAENSVATEEPVKTLRHKIIMKRDTEAFQGDVVVKREKIQHSELVNVPAGTTTFNVSKKPVKESMRFAAPFFGSYSCPLIQQGLAGASAPMDLDFLEFNVDIAPVDNLRFELPYIAVPNIEEHIRVLVNGELWEFCRKSDIDAGINNGTSYDNSNVGIDENSKIYFLGRGGRELQFGHNIEEEVEGVWTKVRKGALPPGGAKVQICMDGDNPRLELTDKGYVLNLTSPSDGFKENVSIISIDAMSMGESIDKSFYLTPGLDRFVVPVDSIGSRTQAEAERDNLENVLDDVAKKQLSEANEGLVIPVINPDKTTWYIDEIIFGRRLDWHEKYFKYNVPYINGRTELHIDYENDYPSGINSNKEARYSFNPETGILYLNRKVPFVIAVLFKYKVLKYTNVPEDKWEFYKTEVGQKINTSKIIIDPKYVRTMKRKTEVYVSDTNIKSVDLIGDSQYDNDLFLQPRDHGWYKQRIVKGTVVLKKELFNDNVKRTEVRFVNGLSELQNTTSVTEEPISATEGSIENRWEFNLAQINTDHELYSAPGFAAVRSVSNPSTPSSQFKHMAMTPNDIGDDYNWSYKINNDGTCTVYIQLSSGETLREHTSEYTYSVIDPGVDARGLYSIDYENGVVHFAEPIVANGDIKYEVSTYSAFYNIADVIREGDIKEINEETREITISDSLSMKFLKQSSALKARPAYIRAVYDYYQDTTESLADLEPYYSPICKDIAVRAVTSDLLEEL